MTAPVFAIAQTPTTLDITIDGKPFTTYRFVETPDDPGWHRPYFYPVLMPGDVEITADRYRQTLHDATPEHPWHRSVWVGFGDVNGVDHWGHPAGEKKSDAISNSTASTPIRSSRNSPGTARNPASRP